MKTKPTWKLSRYNQIIERTEGTFIWNTMTNSLIRLNPEGLNYIQNFDGTADDSSFFNILKENGCIVDSRFNELGKILNDEKTVILNMYPEDLHFTIAPGLGCNYNCIYCFEKNRTSFQSMDENTQKQVTDYIINTAASNPNLKRICITWFGGEPLLYRTAISFISHALMTYCENSGIEYSAGIVTNGRYLDRAAAEELRDLKVCYVQLSFDGMPDLYKRQKRASQEDFDCTVQNIIESADILPITIRVNLSDNYEDALSLTEYLLKEKGLDGKIKIYLAHIRDYDSLDIPLEKESQKQFYKLEGDYIRQFVEEGRFSKNSLFFTEPKRRCTTCYSVCGSNACIGPSGELYRCEHFFGQEQYVVGTVTDGRFYSADETDYLQFRHLGKCLSCNMFPICLGGCMNDMQDGDVPIACDALKERLIDYLMLNLRNGAA